MRKPLGFLRARASVLTLAGALTLFGYGGCTIDAPYLVDYLGSGVSIYEAVPATYFLEEVVDVIDEEPYVIDEYYESHETSDFLGTVDDGFGFGFGFDWY